MTLINYTAIEIRENNEPLVDLSETGLIVQPKYFEQKLSPESRLFAREGIAKKLLAVEKRIAPYKLKIWDAHRPRTVQDNIYKRYWRELQSAHPDWDHDKLWLETGKFVSPPFQKDRIPPHVTGGALDLTLAHKDGADLEMGSEFDNFGPESEPFFFKTGPACENREILREAMTEEGFTQDQDEWWHFDYGNQSWALKGNHPFAFYGEKL